jgi:hypothetical protein
MLTTWHRPMSRQALCLLNVIHLAGGCLAKHYFGTVLLDVARLNHCISYYLDILTQTWAPHVWCFYNTHNIGIGICSTGAFTIKLGYTSVVHKNSLTTSTPCERAIRSSFIAQNKYVNDLAPPHEPSCIVLVECHPFSRWMPCKTLFLHCALGCRSFASLHILLLRHSYPNLGSACVMFLQYVQ